MTWNYRLVKKGGEVAIYSAYYDENGQVEALSVDPSHVCSYSVEEVETILQLMMECLEEPVLDHEEHS